ncbi:glyoxylase-like metal-dependent hydrolase (beta-lactamase superfamily II) [Roseimicrobium gellanilyticum]|uniref:Glyoxylase-like metal-dependent hydrolase (Beta-lactamase superfamily II) n=1 Tax=Roseimicrobium gellanilyticum TaxID=748857 RepID=A0A366HDL7_9BACT|nr:MBL fold metallo-hydrolase [Roseimicrobium gellanilyticum]RBP40541.1 glyoxylase-like metal-dependent hydrolase (beta-lactamase superfamily II) [Roseimicrobium gellanilyticum]
MLRISTYTGGIAQTNGYLVNTPTDSFLVDAPDGVADWLRRQGVKVSHLLLTHQHFDHVQDAAAVQREHGAKVWAFAPFSRELTLEFLMGFVSGTSFAVAEYAVDEVLEGRDAIEVGGLTWKLAHIPGHSADSVTFYSETEKLVFGGDVLFAGSIGRTDFPGGNLEILLAGIQKHLLVLPDDTRVLPGHMEETTIGEEREGNPYLEG